MSVFTGDLHGLIDGRSSRQGAIDLLPTNDRSPTVVRAMKTKLLNGDRARCRSEHRIIAKCHEIKGI